MSARDVVHSVESLPWGPVRAFTYGNGELRQSGYDLGYSVISRQAAGALPCAAPSFISRASRESFMVESCLRRRHSHFSCRQRMARSLTRRYRTKPDPGVHQGMDLVEIVAYTPSQSVDLPAQPGKIDLARKLVPQAPLFA